MCLIRATLKRDSKNYSLSHDDFYTYVALNKFTRLILPFLITNDIDTDFAGVLNAVRFFVVPKAVSQIIFDRWTVSVAGVTGGKKGTSSTSADSDGLSRYFANCRNGRIKDFIRPFKSGGTSKTGRNMYLYKTNIKKFIYVLIKSRNKRHWMI